MTNPLTVEAAVQARADEEAWLAGSPERCETCGHRECFHAHDGEDGLFCLVDDCRCRDGSLDDPSEAPVPGVYGEAVFASGKVPAVSIATFGGPPEARPGVYLEILFDKKEPK